MRCFHVITAIFLALNLPSALAKSENSQRIIHGQDVNSIENFAHMVSIQRGMSGFWQHVCGGAIIANRAILTAASCVAFNAVYRVRAGILFVNEPLTFGQTSDVETYAIFTPPTVNPLFNIAILILRTPLNIAGTSVQVMRVPPANWGIPNPAGGILTGWGANNISSPELSERLQQAAVTFTATCTDFPAAAAADFICSAAPTPGNNASTGCTGDMGSPLIHGNFVIGVLARYARPCNTHTDLYVRVNARRSWIENTLSQFNMNLI